MWILFDRFYLILLYEIFKIVKSIINNLKHDTNDTDNGLTNTDEGSRIQGKKNWSPEKKTGLLDSFLVLYHA